VVLVDQVPLLEVGDNKYLFEFKKPCICRAFFLSVLLENVYR